MAASAVGRDGILLALLKIHPISHIINTYVEQQHATSGVDATQSQSTQLAGPC